jgi:hypothetical protein
VGAHRRVDVALLEHEQEVDPLLRRIGDQLVGRPRPHRRVQIRRVLVAVRRQRRQRSGPLHDRAPGLDGDQRHRGKPGS